MKITLISWDNLGYISLVDKEMKRQGHTVNHIKMNELSYSYPNFFIKFVNAFTKTLFNYNFKREKLAQNIEKEINEMPRQDLILVVSSDWLPQETIKKLKKKTDKIIAWFYDAVANYPRIPKMIYYFDKVYTFEPKDAENYDIDFLPNFNPYNELQFCEKKKNYLFHISSQRKNRKEILTKIAQQLKSSKIPYDIFLISKKPENNDFIQIQTKGIPLQKVYEKLEEASFQIDIQRDRQSGVSFRIFEAMGLQQKVITTNQDIENYDFFNPNNIHILKNDSKIPIDFLTTPYEDIPNEIYKKYTIENWVKQITLKNDLSHFL
ncbi:hypothetical protein NMK71_11435 [Weeksellaceae bacterium KMM 9713]|uniref:Uncharacterized protein n=1 Tax=Profundicola chukchiensis TaxID=2961959 RepID=A0A9X4RXT3_9FLAO|nr:hypothetical protein [Profundicola chukchiensis]MDG4947024.1 hypothetical protein [Profundicola chukchiensis]MDG4949366.1 hypothetical protein [Profundicola chukchiensis]